MKHKSALTNSTSLFQDPTLVSDSTTVSRSNFSVPNPSNAAASTIARTALGLDPPSSLASVSSVVHRLLTKAPPPTRSSQQRFLNMSYMHHLENRVHSVISNMWADSTTSNRQYLWARFTAFAESRNLNLELQMDWSISLFIEHCLKENKNMLKSTQLQYAKDLAAIASRLQLSVPITRMYMSGLRASGALVPQNQAPPIKFPQLVRLIRASLTVQGKEGEHLPQRLYTQLFFMWKTASRFDEVQRLESRQLQVINNNEILINWADKTKATRADPFRNDTVTILRHTNGIPQIVLDVINNKLRPGQELLPYLVNWFDRWIKKVFPPD